MWLYPIFIIVFGIKVGDILTVYIYFFHCQWEKISHHLSFRTVSPTKVCSASRLFSISIIPCWSFLKAYTFIFIHHFLLLYGNSIPAIVIPRLLFSNTLTDIYRYAIIFLPPPFKIPVHLPSSHTSNTKVLFQIPAAPFLPYTLLHPLKWTHDRPKSTEYPAFLSGMLSLLHLFQYRCSQYMIPNYGKGSSSWQYSGHKSCPLQKAQIFVKILFTSSSNLSFSSSFCIICLHLHWHAIKRICSLQTSSPFSRILSSAFASSLSICLLSSPVK